MAILPAFLVFVLLLGQNLPERGKRAAAFAEEAPAAVADGKCTPPDWAVRIGHVEMWKLHNNCK